jgi:hypothetical protein
MEFYLIVVLILLVSLYLNGNFLQEFFSPAPPKFAPDKQIALMEFLAQHSHREKNYAFPPNEYQVFGRAVEGKIAGDVGEILYTFPLVDHHEVEFSCTLAPAEVSYVIDQFGASSDCLRQVEKDRYQVNPSASPEYLKRELNKGGFRLDEGGLEVDYNRLAQWSAGFGKTIADLILAELQNVGKDTYQNRVSAATNFVQFIPYGQPHFDKGKDVYMGVGLPHESVVLSYSDCDSKSLLLASILVNLISYENIVFALCITSGPHMILGVAGMPNPNNRVKYGDKQYVMIETTVPMGLDEPFLDNVQFTKFIPLTDFGQ